MGGELDPRGSPPRSDPPPYPAEVRAGEASDADRNGGWVGRWVRFVPVSPGTWDESTTSTGVNSLPRLALAAAPRAADRRDVGEHEPDDHAADRGDADRAGRRDDGEHDKDERGD